MNTERLAATLAEQVDPQRITQLTLDMVRIPSPPGEERAVSELYADVLRDAGLEVELDYEFPSSPSVVAWLRGSGRGPTLQLDGHTDTVDLPGPEPRFENGFIHGRGSEDMKASLAAMAEAARIVRAAGVQLKGDLLLTAHGRHESATNETLISLIEKGVHGDAVIVTELGGKDLPVTGMGLAFWELRIAGDDEGIHETVAKAGAPHAVMAGYRAVQLLQEKAAELADIRHLYLGAESIFIGRFQGGDYFNRMPASCVIAGTRRFGPGCSLDAIREEFERLAARVKMESGANVEVWLDGIEGYSVDENERLAKALRRSHQQVTGKELPLAGTRAAANVPHFVHLAHVPALYYGASYLTAHSELERVELAQVVRAAKVYIHAILAYLGVAE
ncbi:MAG: M20/M25/M40 family metallo-hydrolase [Caldilineaceae bacterium]|nr:M20/M25/M40 family metallo-hydrolase [Caldilineaceae bacterium]